MLKRNVVELVGNLVDNPEFKDMGEFQVANFFLAVDRVVELNDGNTADFIPIVCKNDLAKAVDTYARKGRRVFVDGRAQVRTYDDDQGNRRWITEIVAVRIQYLDAPPGEVMNGNQASRKNSNNQGGNSQGNGDDQRNKSRGNYNNGNHSNQGNGNYRNTGGRDDNGNGGGNQRYGNSNGSNQRYGNSGGNQSQNNRSYSNSGSNGRMPWES